MSPAWGPKGDVLAYTSFFDGPPGLYLADLASGRKRPLVTSGSLNTSPSVRPRRRPGGLLPLGQRQRRGLHRRPVGRLAPRRLTHSNAIDTNPAWSPKGSEIAFTSSRAGNPHIYLMDAEGANQRRLTFDGTYNDGAAWSPEGDLITYTSRRGGQFQIAVTSIVTLATRVLTSGPGENESPTFSPDGRWIAFTSRRGGSKQIYVMDLDGRQRAPAHPRGQQRHGRLVAAGPMRTPPGGAGLPPELPHPAPFDTLQAAVNGRCPYSSHTHPIIRETLSLRRSNA